jgi:hypothetical protein
MESKISKAQIEVWEWKESLFEDLKMFPGINDLNLLRIKSERQSRG